MISIQTLQLLYFNLLLMHIHFTYTHINIYNKIYITNNGLCTRESCSVNILFIFLVNTIVVCITAMIVILFIHFDKSSSSYEGSTHG